MCRQCATKYAMDKARARAGFVEGTQLKKLAGSSINTDSLSGVRGVYYYSKTGKYIARIKFKGKSYYLGAFSNLEDAAKARQKGEETLFAPFLEAFQ